MNQGNAAGDPAAGEPGDDEAASENSEDAASTSDAQSVSGEASDTTEADGEASEPAANGDEPAAANDGAEGAAGTPDEDAPSGEDGVPGEGKSGGKEKAYGELDGGAPSENPIDPSQVGQSDVVLEATSQAPPHRRTLDQPTTRWSEVGGFVGMVNRDGGGGDFRYKTGVVYGGYFRPQITNWLGVRLYYRQETIPVDVSDGAFDVGDTPDFDFSQPSLSVTSLGLRIEPTWNVLPRVQLMGILGWGWVRFVAEMPTAPEFSQEADRAAVELNWGLGAGIGVDVVKNWINVSVKGTYSFITNQTGSAIDDDVQAIVDGKVYHLAPLDPLGNPWDLLFSLGVIL